MAKIRRFFIRHLRKMRFLPSKFYAKIHYEYFNRKKLNLNNPTDFNAKIQWYKVFFRPPILNNLVDKFAVRKYVTNKIGEQYLNSIYGVYNNPNEIDFSNLPHKFVIKATHTSGHNIIITNKEQLNIKKTLAKINKWLQSNQFYKKGQEWAYKDVTPRIIIEKFLKENNNQSLIDYKFYCFNGKPKFIDVHLDRETQHKQGCFDLKFNPLPFGKSSTYSAITKPLKKPTNLEEMITLATTLASNLPFVRVDFYSVNGKSIFGEMTFYPSDARKRFVPEKYNKIIGDYFILPKVINDKPITQFTIK